MALFFVGLAAGVAYFIFKICRIYDVSQAWKYKYVNEVLTFFGKIQENIDEFRLIPSFITSMCHIIFITTNYY
jgi:hypothetical protein